jgi:hypothetical protein
MLLEPVETAFDHIASPIDDRVEPERSATPAASAGPVGPLIGPLGDGVPDVAAAQLGPQRSGAVALVGQQMLWAGARPAGTGPSDPDPAKQRDGLGVVVDVAAGQQQRQRPTQAITGQMQLGGQPTTGPSEGFVSVSVAPLRPPAAC